MGIDGGLEGFADLASAAGRPRRAARLFGAAEALREMTGAPLEEADRAGHERQVGVIRKRLGVQTLTNEWTAGRSTSPEDAARFALRVRVDEPSSSTGRSALTRPQWQV